jgi:hypothetical protein
MFERHPQRWFDREGNQISREQSKALEITAGYPGREFIRTSVAEADVVTTYIGSDYTNEVGRPYNFEQVVVKRDEWGSFSDGQLMDYFPSEKEAMEAHEYTAQALHDGHDPMDIVPRDKRILTPEESDIAFDQRNGFALSDADLDVRDELDELQRADERFAYDDTERFKAALNSPTYEAYLARETERVNLAREHAGETVTAMSFNPSEINAIKRARIIHSLDKEAPAVPDHSLPNVEARLFCRDGYEKQMSSAEWSVFNRENEGRSR